MAKDNAVVMAALKTAGAATAANNVTLNPANQTDLLLLALNQKISALLAAHGKLVQLMLHDPASPTSVAADIQGIDAEVNLCVAAINTIEASQPIQFPTAAQITALSASVRALGNATATSATVAGLLPAITAAINTFPT